MPHQHQFDAQFGRELADLLDRLTPGHVRAGRKPTPHQLGDAGIEQGSGMRLFLVDDLAGYIAFGEKQAGGHRQHRQQMGFVVRQERDLRRCEQRPLPLGGAVVSHQDTHRETLHELVSTLPRHPFRPASATTSGFCNIPAAYSVCPQRPHPLCGPTLPCSTSGFALESS